MKPERRAKINGYEIFIADGFSKVPHFTYGSLGAEPGEFPNGAFCTLWFTVKGEENLDVGLPMFFEKDHDPHFDEQTKKQARLNTAFKQAESVIKTRDRYKGASMDA